MKISVIIPACCPGKDLLPAIEKLKSQNLPSEIIILDSLPGSDAKTVCEEQGCLYLFVPPETFRHGGTRNKGAKMASGKFLVFMTQDAIPENEFFLEKLIDPLQNKTASASFARQVPRADADPLEKFSREFNYPEKSFLKGMEDLPRLGIKTYFLSNVASAFDREVFWNLGGFDEELIVNEDMNLTARMIQGGHKVAYQAEARVIHSHKNTLRSLAGRYFDIGVFFAQSGKVLQCPKTEGEGKRFVKFQLLYLFEKRKWWWFPRFFTEVFVKYVSYKAGLKYRYLPLWLRKLWSQHFRYWENSP